MAKNKTTETETSVTGYINAVPDEVKRNDSYKLIELMSSLTGCEAKLWGPSIVGFGSYHYKYESGREGDMPIVAFSPRKEAISLYLHLSPEKREELLPALGKHKSGKGCIYVKKLVDIDINVLNEMISVSIARIKSEYSTDLK